MSNTKSPVSFKAKIIQLSTRIFLLMGVIGLLAIYAIYKFQDWDFQSRNRDYLTRNVETQINRLIPTFLLQEQWAGTQMILEEIRLDEDLSLVSVIPDLGEVPVEFGECQYELDVDYCLLSSAEEVGVVAPILEGGVNFGYLMKLKSRKGVLSTARFLQLMYIVFIVLGLSILLLTFSLLRYVNKEGKSFLKTLTSWLAAALSKSSSSSSKRPLFKISEMNDLAEQIESLIVEHEDSTRRAIVADIARQVAHDIRSPLAALEMSVRDLRALPEEKRLLIRSACEEIHDIINVLRESKVENSGDSLRLANEALKVELLLPLVETLLSEKRMQYKNRENIKFKLSLKDDARILFARINQSDFKRVMSNLINNAVEALSDDEQGVVQVSWHEENGFIHIEVTDNGTGMSTEALSMVFERGVTFGKSGGTGLGLFHAKECVDQWSGRIDVSSEVAKGTTVRVLLPRVPEPSWFASEIVLHKGKKIVILDDDPSVHLIWKSRLKPMLDEGLIDSVFNFHTGKALLDWWATVTEDLGSELLFLLDYELINENYSGMDLMKKIGLYNQTVFVTSHYDEEPLQQECVRHGSRMIAKNMAAFIPLKSIERGDVSQYVLIDDSKVTRMSWRFRAQAQNINFQDYSSVDEFKTKLSSTPKSTVIYIDSDLGDGKVRGEEYAKVLFDMGFEHLYLATGHKPEDFEQLGFLRGVVAKDPPWI